MHPTAEINLEHSGSRQVLRGAGAVFDAFRSRPARLLPVARAGVDAHLFEQRARELGDEDRAVLASGASNADGEVASVVALVWVPSIKSSASATSFSLVKTAV